jgi:hypothetical protein
MRVLRPCLQGSREQGAVAVSQTSIGRGTLINIVDWSVVEFTDDYGRDWLCTSKLIEVWIDR